jgi:hypothetical protein
MADSQAWAEGAAIGSERAKEHRAHKQALSEEERQSKAQLYASNLTNLQQKISSLLKAVKSTTTPSMRFKIIFMASGNYTTQIDIRV